MLALTISLLSLLVLPVLFAPAAMARSWQPPVEGAVLRAFAVGGNPYARGQHRGVDLASARGSPIRSACPGRVTFAGRVPRGGLTLSVRCGAIVATYQQLGTTAVRERDRVARGSPLGTVGRSRDPAQPRPHVHLGAREAATGRYIDPLGLLGGAPVPAPIPPGTRTAPRATPLGPAPASPRVAPRPVPVSPRGVAIRPGLPFSQLDPARPPPRPAWQPPPPSPVDAPGAHAREPGPGAPWSVWVGLACIGVGLPVGGFVRLRRRRNATRHVAQTA